MLSSANTVERGISTKVISVPPGDGAKSVENEATMPTAVARLSRVLLQKSPATIAGQTPIWKLSVTECGSSPGTLPTQVRLLYPSPVATVPATAISWATVHRCRAPLGPLRGP